MLQIQFIPARVSIQSLEQPFRHKSVTDRAPHFIAD